MLPICMIIERWVTWLCLHRPLQHLLYMRLSLILLVTVLGYKLLAKAWCGTKCLKIATGWFQNLPQYIR